MVLIHLNQEVLHTEILAPVSVQWCIRPINEPTCNILNGNKNMTDEANLQNKYA